MIVDDDKRILLLLEKFLSTYADCVVADNGKDAVKAFRVALEEGRPFAAVFMDIMMPDASGHEVVQLLRAIEKEVGVEEVGIFKLVMISAISDVKNVTFSFFKGQADAFVAKPFSKKDLIDNLKQAGVIEE